MVSLQGLSQGFSDLLLENFPFVGHPGCLLASCPERCLDYLEVYSGKGNLSSAVQRVTCCCFWRKHLLCLSALKYG